MELKTKMTLGFIAFALIFVVQAFVPIPIETTTNGKHTGIVTAIEDNGLIWKTTTVYFKTSAYTSQEDTYCLRRNSDNYEEYKQTLNSYIATGEKIEIQFKSHLAVPVTECSQNTFITGLNTNVSQT